MASSKGANEGTEREEDCVLSLLALKKQERSVTPELNANTARPSAKTADSSPLPVAAGATIPKKPLHVTQLPLHIPNTTRQVVAMNGIVSAHATPVRTNVPPTFPYGYQNAARLVAPPSRQVPMFPSANMMEEFWLTQAPVNGGMNLAKRKRNDYSHPLVQKQSLVPILPNGWEPDRDFDDTSPDAPLLPHYPQLRIDTVIGGSPLVKKQDRNLVPDALFVAMAQLEPCRLTIADKTGSYRKLELGFVGFCCKHCGGQPGFGRYFPSTQRSCAQTTSSQTIVKHMDSKCRYVPDTIRNVIVELERIHQHKELTNELGRPRYGARKVFFQRVWKRLREFTFSDEAEELTAQSLNETAATEQKEQDEKTAIEEEEDDADDDDESKEKSEAESTRESKHSFGQLPAKNKRARV
jgi:hypothetical protein